MTDCELMVNEKRTGIRFRKAETFFARFWGLLGRKTAKPGLLIVNCNSIHTFFMRTSIDVVFTGPDGNVIRAIERVRPWRVVLPVRGAALTYEFEPGTISNTGIRTGDICGY